MIYGLLADKLLAQMRAVSWWDESPRTRDLVEVPVLVPCTGFGHGATVRTLMGHPDLQARAANGVKGVHRRRFPLMWGVWNGFCSRLTKRH